MAIPVANPRRRSQKDTVPQTLSSLESAAAMSLRKSDTFNARDRALGKLVTPFEVASLMPKRSPTNPKTLEELLAEGEDHVEYISKLLSDFNLAWKSNKPLVADASILADRDVLDVPTFAALEGRSQPIDIAGSKLASYTDHHHDSDSGLGTSIDSTVTEKELSARSSANTTPRASIIAPHTSHFFSKESVRQIKKHIVQPILDEPSLQEFHPLIEDIPRRIGAKFIINLRDLEKTLFFLAPDYASSPAKFLQFCNTSIECLQTTVDLICERDQRKPTDRPYTNNYFVDLVDQIRRYAEIMKHTREKQERGEELDEMDYTPDEEIIIQGGLSNNGRPAELIRKKTNGKGIALTDDTMLDDIDEGTSSKRPLTDADMDEDEIYRSMARRRKSDKAGDVIHTCRVCDKDFKRPCDLTKHEKTHTRPWKCPDAKCKYHGTGWPTEKERDRHMNDKHSAAPTMYKCDYSPCSYSSKRESNCKQHMEKAHGWEYLRSKQNGRNKAAATATANSSSAATPLTPLTPFMATPATHPAQLATPQTPFAGSPFGMQPMSYGAYGFNNFATLPPTPSDASSMFSGRRESVATAASVGPHDNSYVSPIETAPHSFDDIMAQTLYPMDPAVNMLAPLQDNTLYQQPTPALSINNAFGSDYTGFSKASPVPAMSGIPNVNSNNIHLSPNGHGNMTLYSPEDSISFDDSFNFEAALGGQASDFGNGDFQLYNSPGPGEAGPSNYQNHLSPGGVSDSKEAINTFFDENGNYIGADLAITSFDWAY